MRRVLRSASVGSVALVCLMASGGAAHAVSDKATYKKGCINYVKMARSGGKVKAYGKMYCKGAQPVLRPQVALSASNGKHGFVSDGKPCKFAKSCTTPKVSLPAKKGLVYRASNPGTANGDGTGTPGSVAHVTHKLK